MTSYLYLSDIHGNFEALKHLKDLPEMFDPDYHIRFGGDFIDGFDLQPKAIIKTLRLIKDLCDNGKAKAILGNHDDFILKATFKLFENNWWYLNGQKETLENLGITNPRSQGCPRFQSGEELANSVGKINACYLL